MVPNSLSENNVLNEDPAKLKSETFHEIPTSTVEEGPYTLIEVGDKAPDVKNNGGADSNSQPMCPPHSHQNTGSLLPDTVSTAQKVRYSTKITMTVMLYRNKYNYLTKCGEIKYTNT